MPMSHATSCGPNLTANKLRRTCGDCCMQRFRVDPTWGIPPGVPPLSIDATTGLVRPFSSYTTLGTAMATFIGFSNEWFPPNEDHLVWVHLCGWVEMQLSVPAVVRTGWKYIPVDSGAISDYLAVRETIMVAGIWTAVDQCWCENDWVPRLNCPPAVIPAADVSPITAGLITGDYITQRTVMLQFGDCCRLTGETIGDIGGRE